MVDDAVMLFKHAKIIASQAAEIARLKAENALLLIEQQRLLDEVLASAVQQLNAAAADLREHEPESDLPAGLLGMMRHRCGLVEG